MSKLPGYENMVICPYNKCHTIMKSRLQTHLVKCAKQHPDIKLETCPFDITHKFRAEEKDAHIEDCPSRENFDRYIYSASTSNSKPADVQKKPPPRKDYDDDEDWD